MSPCAFMRCELSFITVCYSAAHTSLRYSADYTHLTRRASLRVSADRTLASYSFVGLVDLQ
eukprot:5163371-Prymnesium_polylepis.1